MSKTVEIEEPHGFLQDSDGRICLRFGGWEPGRHEVPEYVDTQRKPEYVGGPAAHDGADASLEAHPDIDDLPDPAGYQE